MTRTSSSPVAEIALTQLKGDTLQKEAWLQLAWTALLPVLKLLGSTALMYGAWKGLENKKYIASKLFGEERDRDLLEDEKELYNRYRREGYSPEYSYERAVRDNALRLGITSDEALRGLQDVSQQERAAYYGRVKEKTDAARKLLEQVQNTAPPQPAVPSAVAEDDTYNYDPRYNSLLWIPPIIGGFNPYSPTSPAPGYMPPPAFPPPPPPGQPSPLLLPSQPPVPPPDPSGLWKTQSANLTRDDLKYLSRCRKLLEVLSR